MADDASIARQALTVVGVQRASATSDAGLAAFLGTFLRSIREALSAWRVSVAARERTADQAA